MITRPDGCPECPARPGAVTRVFRDIAPAVLWIGLASGQVFGVTEGHEVWTQQAGWTSACELSVGDAFVDAAGEPVEIVDIVFDPTPTPVYNLEVDGAFTYFAEGVWVHNHTLLGGARSRSMAQASRIGQVPRGSRSRLACRVA